MTFDNLPCIHFNIILHEDGSYDIDNLLEKHLDFLKNNLNCNHCGNNKNSFCSKYKKALNYARSIVGHSALFEPCDECKTDHIKNNFKTKML